MPSDTSDIRRFLLIDDHTIVRSALKTQCLETYPDSVFDESADGQGILELLDAHFYNLIILDIQIPNLDTLLLIKNISLNHPEVPVLVYSMTAANIYALKVMKAGAKGFVSKESSIEELETAIGLALQGKRYISEEIAGMISETSFRPSFSPFSTLSSRQLQIASLLLSGHTVTEISKLLELGISTIGTHKSKIFKKLNVKNLLQLKQVADLHKF
jgi:two-component system, NarL family, invasion response regulator UvrY